MKKIMDEFLAFVDYEGKSVNGYYTFRFDFTPDHETAWGDFFNVAPSIIVPNLSLDKNCISSVIECLMPVKMLLAKSNSCFSMQDCIDGILPLCFCEIGSYKIEYDGKPLFFNFGETKESVLDKITKSGFIITKHDEVTIESNIIDNLINSLDDGKTS